MNILHITPYVPSKKTSHAGGVCMGKESEWLRSNHEYHLLTFVNDRTEEGLLKEFDHGTVDTVRSNVITKAICALIHPTLPPLFAIRASISFSLKLIGLMKKYNIDAIHAEYTSMGQYAWIKRLFPNTVFNLVEHDVTYQSFERKLEKTSGAQRIFTKHALNQVARKESRWCRQADSVIALSDKDKRLLENTYELAAPVYVLNPYYGIEGEDAKTPKRSRPTICFIGQMSRSENNEAALRLINIYLKNDLASLCDLRIIGANPSEEIIRLCNDHISASGFVEDINKDISSCSIAVFPLLAGAGIKLKVLLAASLSLPVITTQIGAEGIDSDGKAISLANTDEEFAEEIRRLLLDSKYRQEIIRAQSELIQDKFSWEKSAVLLSTLYPPTE